MSTRSSLYTKIKKGIVKKNNLWSAALVSIGFFVLVSYQNCGQSPTADLGDIASGASSCSIKSYSSTGVEKKSFYVGEIANFSLMSPSDGQTIQYSLQKNGVIIQNNNVTTPYYFQLTNKDNTSLGNYTLTMNLLDQGKSVCTKIVNFAVQVPGIKTCQLTANDGTNFVTYQQIPFSITSNPSGMNAYISTVSGDWNRRAKLQTPSNFVETLSTPNTYTVYAEIADENGAYLRCTPDIEITVTAAQVTPTPTGTATPTPTPSPSASPNPAGSITTSMPYANISIPYTISWNIRNAPFGAVYYREMRMVSDEFGSSWQFVTDFALLKCSANASDSNQDLLQAGGLKRYFLFSTNSCSSQPNFNQPLSTVDVIYVQPDLP